MLQLPELTFEAAHIGVAVTIIVFIVIWSICGVEED